MRRLTCIECGRSVTVIEEPVEHIDPGRFVCGQCLHPVDQMPLETPPETRQYDPSTAVIPF